MPWFLIYTLILATPIFGMYYYNVRQILNTGESLWGWRRKIARRWLVGISCYTNLLPAVALVTFWFGGRDAMPPFGGESRLIDLLFVYPFWFSLVITAQLFLLLIVWHALGAPFRKNNAWKNARPKVTLGILTFGFAYSCVTIVLDTWTIRINERELKLPSEFTNLHGIRIAVIADIQGDGRTTPDCIRRYVDKTNALQPDIILFGGDVVTSGMKYVESTVEVLANLRARHGKVAVIGDHDMFSGAEPIIEGMRRAGFTVLQDSSLSLTINETPVLITGVVFTYRQRPNKDDLESATNSENDRFKILLVHQPREELVDISEKKGYHLFAAGHTHGGAIALGIPGIYIVAPSRFETKYFTGFYDVGSMLVAVNNGLGHTLAPIRYQAPVEITLIRLVK
jgi:predicted MPP superfamily phosphohydrolase